MENDNRTDEEKIKDFVNEQEGVDGANPNLNTQVGAELTPAPTNDLPWEKPSDMISANNRVGWQELPMKDLPTQGLFYPEGAKVSIRSATAAEIRHWSTLQEDNLSALDDMLNYILERCVSFKTSENHSSWKDIKEVDRFYILLAVREYTFVKGENHLQVKTSETKSINVTKEMIDYVSFDERIMKYYDPIKRCFSLKFKTGKTIDITIPSVGVTNFIKNYVTRKQQMQEGFDEDFVSFSPFVIPNWRGLSDSMYEKIVLESNNWSISEISVITHLKDLFIDTVNPIAKYVDEGGAERTVPLNFRGGIKSVFLISDPFGELV